MTEQMVISDGIPAVPRNRISRNSVPNPSAEEKTSRNSVPGNRNRSKISEFPSEPFSGRETTRNIVPRNRNRSKLSEFPSKPFSGRENNSEFCPEPFRRRENNSEQNAAAAVSDSTQSESSCRDRKNWFPPPWLKDCSVKLNFFAEFRSIPFRSELRNWLFRGTRNASE